MVFGIDLDRGVMSSTHPTLGMDIYMYLDDPGVYLNAHGTPVTEALAIAAGFEVERFAKKRRIKLALAAAQDKVLEELQAADRAGIRVVTAEKDGFKVIDLGYDRYQVLSPDDDILTKVHLSLRDAMLLLDQLVPESKEPEPETPEDHTKET